MPKVKMEAVKTDEYKNRIIQKIIYQCSLRGYDNADSQSVIGGVSVATFNRRKKDPGNLTFDEIIRYAQKFKMTPAELLADPIKK